MFNGLVKSSQPNEFRAEDLPKMKIFSDSAELSVSKNIMASSMIQLSKVHRRVMIILPKRLVNYV